MSETTPTVLSEVASTAAAITPAAGAVGEVAKLADDIVQLLSPSITSAENDKPVNEQHNRLTQYESIIDNPNEATRQSQLASFSNSLLLDAGIPIGFLSGGTIRVPVEHFTAFIEAAGQLIETREQVAAALNRANAATK